MSISAKAAVIAATFFALAAVIIGTAGLHHGASGVSAPAAASGATVPSPPPASLIWD
jgi:hypothetical protein